MSKTITSFGKKLLAISEQSLSKSTPRFCHNICEYFVKKEVLRQIEITSLSKVMPIDPTKVAILALNAVKPNYFTYLHQEAKFKGSYRLKFQEQIQHAVKTAIETVTRQKLKLCLSSFNFKTKNQEELELVHSRIALSKIGDYLEQKIDWKDVHRFVNPSANPFSATEINEVKERDITYLCFIFYPLQVTNYYEKYVRQEVMRQIDVFHREKKALVIPLEVVALALNKIPPHYTHLSVKSNTADYYDRHHKTVIKAVSSAIEEYFQKKDNQSESDSTKIPVGCLFHEDRCELEKAKACLEKISILANRSLSWQDIPQMLVRNEDKLTRNIYKNHREFLFCDPNK